MRMPVKFDEISKFYLNVWKIISAKKCLEILLYFMALSEHTNFNSFEIIDCLEDAIISKKKSNNK